MSNILWLVDQTERDIQTENRIFRKYRSLICLGKRQSIIDWKSYILHEQII